MRDDALKAVLALSAAYPHAQFTEAGTALWARMLADIDARQLVLAVESLIATSKFCPSIAEVRAAALATSVTDGERSGEEAWGDVLAEIQRVGWCRPPEFDDPVTARAVQCTAQWTSLCGSDIGDMPSHRARFIAAYDAIRQSVRHGMLLPSGLRAEIEAARAGHVRGTLGQDAGGNGRLSDQHRASKELLHGFGARTEASP